ncbi:SlyX family protein [Pseudoduganella sp. LjRoot289]|uniref:SlyX family protein n=1 Tax=Pseudoduganella sp. LjRoot289 TaxID=3342314 RepID=UPI003F4F5F9F
MSNDNSNEERFITIEIKVAHLEDMVDELNQRVYEQQKQIDKLEQRLAALAQHIRDNPQGGQGAVNERPPHY